MDSNEDEVGRADEREEESDPAHSVGPARVSALQVVVGTREYGEA